MTGEKYVYDFTLKKLTTPSGEKCLRTFLEKHCKKWGFQEEKGDGGYEHYQGRLSLQVKRKILNTIKLFKNEFGEGFGRVSPTSTINSKGANFYTYVTKVSSRVAGPWTDKDEYQARVIPRQVLEMGPLRPFQKTIVESANIWDKRTINYVYCPNGNIGKSLLVGHCRAYGIGRALPPLNDYKDLMRMVCDLPTAKMYLFDMPRSQNKDKLFQFYSAIETIKDGYAFDDRYQFKEKVFDCPQIWIFANTPPFISQLSTDRWKIWTVTDGTYELESMGTEQVQCLIDP